MSFANHPLLINPYVLCQRGMQTLHVCPRQHYEEGEEGFAMGTVLAQFRFAPQFILQPRQREDGNESASNNFNESLTFPPEEGRNERRPLPPEEGRNEQRPLPLEEGRYEQLPLPQGEGWGEGKKSASYSVLPLNDDGSIAIHLDQAERQHLHIAGEELTIERFVKPAWAEAISCSLETLTVTTRSADTVFTWYWHPPEIGGHFINESLNSLNPLKPGQWHTCPGFWYYLPPDDSSGLTPDWAETAIRDPYGLCADVNIAGVSQRFRWIPPGSFQMGSPEEEKGQSDDETPYQVTLSQGYWLADTACTQALWQTVMSNNPSEFKGVNRPVDSASWNNAQQFIETLNQQQPGLNLRLPSEAEWEYACRAGTTGAFNFDGELSLDKVNYRGTWEYKSDQWGEGALQRMAEVKRYPANAWGLYEMHGNVWEWCQDWYGSYPAQLMTDPTGPETSGHRVLRGGSWTYGGRSCRSANRNANSPGFARSASGFRLARGHQPGQSSSGAVQTPAGTHAAAARGAQTGDGLRNAGANQQGTKTGAKKTKGLIDHFKDLFKK